MTNASILPGDRVLARTAFDEWLPRRAVTGPFMSDFLIVRLCTEDEWSKALSEARDPRSTPWPAEDVRVDEQAQTSHT